LQASRVELASVFRSATERAGLELTLDCPKLGELVFVDRGMWEKIVLNLISNAFKFTFEGGISVSLTQVGNSAELRVQDTGVGIPAQEVSRLFDRFHRVENTRSRTQRTERDRFGAGAGTGEAARRLGASGKRSGERQQLYCERPLGSAHLPADRIGGTRSLASTALGAAPFVEEALRWLPDIEREDIEDEVPKGHELLPVPYAAEGDGGSAERPSILVADDNADMRQYLVRLLAERYNVRAVADGELALAAVKESRPGLVLSDVMMPNLDGFELLRALRSDPGTRTIPIILLSARAGEESRIEGMEQGADDYLIKPFSARELLARVQIHLQMARVRKEGEEALRRRTEQFETLLNEAPLGVYLVDGNFRIRAVNPTALRTFGDIPDVIGRDFSEVIHILWPEAYADEIVERFRHTLETGGSVYRSGADRGAS
jgi:CheY-like chemotaxis protein